MQEISKVKKLDEILFYLNNSNRPIGISEIINEINNNQDVKLSLDELRIALKKLDKDGYIHPSAGNDVFTVSWEGSLFIELGGYEFTIYKNQNELELIQNEKNLLAADREHNLIVANNMEVNARRLNTLTFWLAIGTGILSVIEISRILMPAFQYYCHCQLVWQK